MMQPWHNLVLTICIAKTGIEEMCIGVVFFCMQMKIKLHSILQK